MKKHLLFLSLITGNLIYAQVPEDAMRFSFYPQSGTARNIAIGGAMGSLGGDVTATFVNPAGLGFFKTNELVFTPGFTLNKNKVAFRETNAANKANNFALGTNGFVWAHNNRYRKSSNALSVAITQTADFNNTIKYNGLNDYSSMAEQFAEEFVTVKPNEVLLTNSAVPYGAAPAFNTYLIDTFSIGGQLFVKPATGYILDAGQALKQEMTKTTQGGMYELAVGFAHHSNDKWLFGGTISMPFVSYKSNTYFKESDTSSNTSNHFNYFEYTDDFTTTGVGLNGKLGIIYRPQEYIRLGLAVHTPMFMYLTDKRTTGIKTYLENPVESFTETSKTFTNGQPGESKYVQATPFKAILSASYVFREVENVKRQRAFITADIEYVHHKGSRFSSDNESPTEDEKAYFKQLNSVIKGYYKGNFNFRVGGELKFNTIMGRLGFAYYTSPYKEKELKANRMILSGGLGYRNKGVFVDVTYAHAFNKDVNFPYRLGDKANTFAEVKNQRGNIVATVGFKF
ncbi:MAG: hypothetical protein IPP48_00705 [Chitinophagaceae bacterium]|nr:hypothetical protein [Chitinophagaceae bacterium]